MVWRNVPTTFDPSRCPDCGAEMRLALTEPRPTGSVVEFERHIYRCDRCATISRFVIDRKGWELATA